MPDDEQVRELALRLAEADADHALDVEHLGEMDPEEIDYLARAGELEDPATDGIENERCV